MNYLPAARRNHSADSLQTNSSAGRVLFSWIGNRYENRSPLSFHSAKPKGSTRTEHRLKFDSPQRHRGLRVPKTTANRRQRTRIECGITRGNSRPTGILSLLSDLCVSVVESRQCWPCRLRLKRICAKARANDASTSAVSSEERLLSFRAACARLTASSVVVS